MNLRLCLVSLAVTASVASSADAPKSASRTFELNGSTGAFTAERGYGYDLGMPPTVDGAPFFFSASVPEGNFQITIAFGDDVVASSTTVKAESRRLLVENVAAKAGETVTRTVLVNVRNSHLPPPPKNAPGGSEVIRNERETGSLTWDDKLTFEFDGTQGKPPKVRSIMIEPVGGKTVFLVGDSTVCDQRFEDGASWGQMLPRFLPAVVVANHAESGETLKSFITGLRLAKVLTQLRPGDFMLIQFGHNDEKKQWPQTYVEAYTTYKAYLRVFLAEARQRGVTPIFVTSMQRRDFESNGKIRNTHGDYPEAMRELAVEEKVALIDLERMSTGVYEALGPGKAALAFANHGKDITHHNNYGAYELAKCVAQGLRSIQSPLAKYLAPDFGEFNPAHPDDPATFAFPSTPLHGDSTLNGN